MGGLGDYGIEILFYNVCLSFKLSLGKHIRTKGLAGKSHSFSFHVWSGDYGKHFHVIHKRDGTDARYSFPDIELINYKLKKNKISQKQNYNIKTIF